VHNAVRPRAIASGKMTSGIPRRSNVSAMATPTIEQLVKRIDSEFAASGEHEVEWQGSASKADLEAIEIRLGCRLPASFREFLLMTGGGGLRPLYISTAAINDEGGSVIGDTLYWREDYRIRRTL
jgi:hypothetical protein